MSDTTDTRTTREQRADLEALRGELGDTVEELAGRVDVPARVRARRDEVARQVRHGVDRGRAELARRAPAVQRTLTEQPLVVGGAAAGLVALLLLRRRVRRG